MLEKLINIDQAIFRKLNGEWTNPFFDALFPWLRNSATWIPLYLFLFVFSIVNFKQKGWWWTLMFIATIALCDMTGTYLFKHNIERLRPCADPDFYTQVRLVIDKCAGGYGFISNHAANHFGMAAFFYFTYRQILPRLAWIGWLWAFLIIYAQVYIGVHYPLDVLCGAAVGLFFGSSVAFLFNKRFGFAIFDTQSTVGS